LEAIVAVRKGLSIVLCEHRLDGQERFVDQVCDCCPDGLAVMACNGCSVVRVAARAMSTSECQAAQKVK
jgi:hypothetical protein